MVGLDVEGSAAVESRLESTLPLTESKNELPGSKG